MGAMTKEEAELELALEIAEAERSGKGGASIVIPALEGGLPPEIATRLEGLWDATLDLGGKVWEVGKVVVKRIVDFIEANPGLTIGIAIGAVVGMFVSSVPLLGPLLQPFVTPVAIAFGIKEGRAIDTRADQGLLNAAIAAAKEFFRLIVDIMLIVAGRPPLDAR